MFPNIVPLIGYLGAVMKSVWETKQMALYADKLADYDKFMQESYLSYLSNPSCCANCETCQEELKYAD